MAEALKRQVLFGIAAIKEYNMGKTVSK